MGNKKKAIIFDLDGTLANTLESIAYSTNKALAQFGLAPFEKERYKYFVGDGAEELMRRCLIADGDTDLKHLPQMKEVYSTIFEENCMYHVEPYEGISELLGALKEKGVMIAVLSNKPHLRTIDVVNTLFGEGFFDMVQGQSAGIRKKPSPEGVFLIAERLKLAKEEIVYIGDTDTDMVTGKSAGVFTIGALWGFRDRAELQENHADAVIAHPDELLRYV